MHSVVYLNQAARPIKRRKLSIEICQTFVFIYTTAVSHVWLGCAFFEIMLFAMLQQSASSA